MKLTLVLRDKKNALKLSTKTIESFIERIKTDTKDRTVGRRREQFRYTDNIESYDRQFPSHLIYPSAEFEKDENDNLRMKTFNGVVALAVDGLETTAEIEAVKRSAQILHYTLAAFIGPSGKEIIILVRVEKLSDAYSTISDTYSSAGATYLTEEEADTLCQEGHRLASAIYQGILPKGIRQEAISVRSCFHMPLDENPYFNPKAVSLSVSAKPLVVRAETIETEHTVSFEPSDEDVQEVSRKTQQLMDFLNAHYQFRYNTIMGYTEYKDTSLHYMDWQPVDDRTLKGLTMKVRLAGIDARDHDVRRYVQSDLIRPYNPIGDYLWEQYDKWDGKDHIRRLLPNSSSSTTSNLPPTRRMVSGSVLRLFSAI